MAMFPSLLLSTVAAAVANVVGIGAAGHRGTPLKVQWPWYHSADEIHTELQNLAESCAGADASLSTVSRMNSASSAGEEVKIDVFRVRGRNAKSSSRAMLVFGEHARELITGETALSLARALCGGGSDSESAQQVLTTVDFVIVANANPLGRKQVESGDYCKRTNEDGVDLNRNWSDEHKDSSIAPGDEMYPGLNGFSEPETQLLRELVDQERPDIYLSVHSGAYLLGMPYGFEEKQPKDSAAMLEVLRPISEKFCSGMCPYGNLVSLIHYRNQGCDIDYVYSQLGTPYVFTWEIYVGEAFRGRYEEEAAELRTASEGASLVQKRHRRSQFESDEVARLRMQGPEAAQEIGSCMDQFNPQSPEETASVASTWTKAFLSLCSDVAMRRSNVAAISGPGLNMGHNRIERNIRANNKDESVVALSALGEEVAWKRSAGFLSA
jgi:hypothetical protein